MVIPLQELQMYKNFQELASDVLELAKEIMPDKLIYLSSFTESEQVILQLSNSNTHIYLTEGIAIKLNQTACNLIDFEKNQPLIFEDISKETDFEELKMISERININAYLGIPISLANGEKFGTLCVVHHDAAHFDTKSVSLLQKIAKMFSYYLLLEKLAYKDSLTGLYNREFLFAFFKEYSKLGGTLFFLDLDGFKKVNDLHGHNAGDQILKSVALRIQKFIKDEENVFAVRLGGDEFIINFPLISSKIETAKQADKLLECLNTWDYEYQLSASIGIVQYVAEDISSLETILDHADNALYQAKVAGKNTYKFFGD